MTAHTIVCLIETDGTSVYALANVDRSCASAVTIRRAQELMREGVQFGAIVPTTPGRVFRPEDFETYFARDWR